MVHLNIITIIMCIKSQYTTEDITSYIGEIVVGTNKNK